jgi:hypothetical protein
LAYLTAKTNGLEDLAAEILEAAGLTEADVDDVPLFGPSTLKPPPVITPTTDLLWPSLSAGENFFDRALVNGQLEGGVEPAYVNGDAAAAGHSALDAWAQEEKQEDIDPEEGGWELDADGEEFQPAVDAEEAPVEEEEELGAGATPGPSETELWVRNSPLAGDHVAAGSFETAMEVSSCFPLVTRTKFNSLPLAASQPPIRNCQFRRPQAPVPVNISLISHIFFTICVAPTSKTSYPPQSGRDSAKPGAACRGPLFGVDSHRARRRLSFGLDEQIG